MCVCVYVFHCLYNENQVQLCFGPHLLLLYKNWIKIYWIKTFFKNFLLSFNRLRRHTGLEWTHFVMNCPFKIHSILVQRRQIFQLIVKPLSISSLTLIVLNVGQSFKVICHFQQCDMAGDIYWQLKSHHLLTCGFCHFPCLEIEEWSVKCIPMTFLIDKLSHIATPLVANNEACQNENGRNVNHHHEQQS